MSWLYRVVALGAALDIAAATALPAAHGPLLALTLAWCSIGLLWALYRLHCLALEAA